jgi:dTDP-4-amino-4,6-dideoxygalactose transaminase
MIEPISRNVISRWIAPNFDNAQSVHRANGSEVIGVSVYCILLHLQPYWRDTYHLKSDDYPVADQAFEHVVSIPIYPKMTDADIEHVIKAVRIILHGSVP